MSDDRRQVIEDLRAAKSELIARGRCTGMYSDGQKVCAMGAIGLVVGKSLDELAAWHWDYTSTERSKRAWKALEQKAPLMPGQESVSVAVFNDAESTTDADVLNLFDKALAELGGLA